MNVSGEKVEKPVVILPDQDDSFNWGGFGVHWKIDGFHTGARFAVVHHSIAPRLLAAPLHFHHNEDEYSYVLEGRLGALLGDHVVETGPGAWVFKPRGQWHTFWNAGDTPCHIIEIISPAGFENYFREHVEAGADLRRAQQINEKYSIDLDVDSISGLCERFHLTHPAMHGASGSQK